MANKHAEACLNYALKAAAIKRLTREISAALDNCAGVRGDIIINCGDSSDDETHLHYYYARRQDPEGIDCPHCLAAHGLVQQRKKARLALGAAKRWVVMLGKAEIRKGKNG